MSILIKLAEVGRGAGILKSLGKAGQAGKAALRVGTSSGSFMEPLNDLIRYLVFQVAPTKTLDPYTTANLRVRGLIGKESYFLEQQCNGLISERAKALYEISRTLIPMGELPVLVRRGIITYEQAVGEAKRHGMDTKRFGHYSAATKPILPGGIWVELGRRNLAEPKLVTEKLAETGLVEEDQQALRDYLRHEPSIPDLVRFAVREVWSEQAVKAFKMDSEFPKPFATAVSRLGGNETHSRNYWRAYWALPSITTAFDLLHRELITISDVKLLLKMHDILPFWRDKLVELSFTPFTRVDTRRMYAAGTISYAEMVTEYKKIGYDKWHATKLADWTVDYVKGRERDLTKTEILDLIDLGAMPSDKGRVELTKLGYSAEESELLVDLRQAKRDHKIKKAHIDALIEQYEHYHLSDEELEANINVIFESEELRTFYKAKAVAQRIRIAKLPSKSDILRWVKKELIDERQGKLLMMQIGYSSDHTDLYLSEVV